MVRSSKATFNFVGLAIIIAGLVSLLGLLSTPRAAFAATGINQQVNFQGRLFQNSGAVVPDGFYNIQFKIYQDGDGQSVGNTTGTPAGSLKWTESWMNANGKGVQVKNGFMSVELGSVTPFGSSVDWNQSTLWLSMNIGSTNATCTPFTSCTPDGEMVPMKRMSSTPYSLNSGMLGGLTSAQFLQFAQGVQTDAATNSNSIFINKTSTGNFMSLQSSGSDAFSINNTGDITFGANANHTLSVAASAAGVAGKTLTVSAGSALNSGTGAGGGDLLLQGGSAAGTGNNNGGNIYLSGGSGTGTGTKGLVNLGVSAFTSNANVSCSANCTISQSNVDNYGTVIVSSSTSGITITLPPPTNTTTSGRIIYITTDNASTDFTLTTNGAPNIVNVAMRNNTTSTMIWNGTAWTPGGASNATTLQATYNNGTNPSTTPEIKLDSIRSTIDIQDADTSIGSDILNIRGSNAAGLGTVLFGVSNSGRVTIQGTSALDSAFRVLDASANYQLNVNSSNGYIINNSTQTPGNEISNPNFEAGGSIASGEEGWFGPAQASIANNNANTGNYSLAVTANTAVMDVYAGTYYEIKPTESVYFQGYVKNSVGANGTGGIQITWYDKDKVVLSRSSDNTTLPGTSYTLKKVSAVAPANAAYFRVSASVLNTATTGTYYFDDFYMKKSVELADTTFRNASDSTAAFRIQSAGSAQTLFTADTSNNLLKVGDSTGTNTATTILVLDGTSADPTTLTNKNGGLFYNTTTNSLKAIVGGAVVDVCTTAVTCAGYTGSAGSTVQLQGSSPGTAQTGNFNITGIGIMSGVQTKDETAASTNSTSLNIKTGNASGTTSNSGSITIDTGSATGTRGGITIGTGNVAVTMGGNLNIQGSNALSLGTSSSAAGSILFRNSVGANTITLRAPGANPAVSYNLTLPQNLGAAGDCLKDTGSGALGFSNCSAGTTVNIQNTYDNSTNPATVTLADNKDLKFVLQDTTTDPNFLIQLQCTTVCGSNGRFAVTNAAGTSDIFTVSPNGGDITMNTHVQIGSSATDNTQLNLQLDSYNQASDNGVCDNSTNQGSMYYNTVTGTIRACVASGWSDVSNPEQLGLLSFGVVPQSGSQPYDLPALQTSGVSGPCKVSRASATQVTWQDCIAYSGGKRVAVTGSTATVSGAINTWQHLCLTAPSPNTNQPQLSTASTTYNTFLPTFNVAAPVLCIADIKMSSTTANNIGQIYDTRTFTSSIKEAVTFSTASELAVLADSGGNNGALVPAGVATKKLYGLVVATNGSTSTTTPNAIITTIGPSWVKATAGQAGDFVQSGTSGYANTTSSVPNNSFYIFAGNARTSFGSGCTSVATCNGSLYVNMIVR